ncbi:hypothetical protein SDC9_206718 [bioreactor metagenome]|uniref:Uncharacterized protein n=1 Tax=bioreactor metagenome TaxID=1076179 RepID=A0A645J5V2_9ZZZZ
MDINTVDIGAALPAGLCFPADDIRGSLLKRCVRHNDQRRVAAQLQRIALNGGGALRHHLAAGLGRSDHAD